MEYPQTEAFRPVGGTMNKAIGLLPSGAFNFGLYFNKWMYVIDAVSLGDGWGRPKKAWHCAMMDETKIFRGEDCCQPNKLLDNLDVSLALFNGSRQYERAWFAQRNNGRYADDKKKVDLPGPWNRAETARILATRHQALDAVAGSFVAVGYELVCIEAELCAPLVIGLGNEHPTEKGFRFDWTLGIPAISATGIKGVVRLAWLVDRLNEMPEDEARQFWKDISGRWKEGRKNGDKPAESRLPKEARQLFGCGEIAKTEQKPEQKAQRGKVIFLDALPATLPRLKAEIMNCHYPDYLNKGTRGPTEDQQPNPQKFWAVDSLDENGEKLRFVFRLLVHRSIAGDSGKREKLLDAVRNALAEHGLGAKTAIGHGRMREDRTVHIRREQEARKRQEEEDQKIRPWLRILAKVEATAEDWGQLRQLLDGADLKEFQAQPEVAQAVFQKATACRANSKKGKWTPDRDKMIADWLQPAGLAWQSLEESKEPGKTLSEGELIAVERIRNLTDWGAWKNLNITMESLPLVVLAELREKFLAWGCKEKSAKKDKQEAWKKIQRYLRS